MDIVAPTSQVISHLTISLLPGMTSELVPPAIVDLRGVPDRDHTLEAVWLLEGVEYRYVFTGEFGSQVLSTDLPEVFAPDDGTGRTGRLRPGLFTGSMRARVFSGADEIGTCSFEVCSKKLEYLTDYRKMITDIAEVATEAVMDRFAASEQLFTSADSGDPLTLYQRFVFLQCLFAGSQFQAAIRQVIARPYESWEAVDEQRRPGQGLRGHRRIATALSQAGPRVAWPGGPVADLPSLIQTQRTEATVDNVPNAFVKFALSRWREVVQQLHDAMLRMAPAGAVNRGVRESQELLDQVDAILGEGLFREIRNLALFPSGNQVLQKREGYRAILRAHVQFEVAAQLAWNGGEEVFRAGQRDVATLYEYWTYIQLAKLLAELCEIDFDLGSLLKESEGGVGLQFRKGRKTVLRGKAVRLGRKLEVELWYNRGFSGLSAASETSWVADGTPEGSWTVGMRPDISIRIRPDPGALEYCDPVWVHFDAKYRIAAIEEILGDTASLEDSVEPGAAVKTAGAAAKREDLIKMHAYRDAIRLSAGAYVLYPGDHSRKCRTYSEILPGLGAFKLRPRIADNAEGASDIKGFLEELLMHAARQASEHERMRFWTSRVHGGEKASAGHRSGPPFQAPPDDTRVLIGFVKGVAHADWIANTRLYNLRADERHGSVSRDLLDCDVLLLWGTGQGVPLSLWRVGKNVETLTAAELLLLGYPQPQGKRYYCLRLTQEVLDWAEPAWDALWLRELLSRLAPAAISGVPARLLWGQLLKATNGDGLV